MQIVILAAGRGTRMKELTDNVPKPMIEIKGKPMLAYKVEALPEEIKEVIFIVGYLGEQIREYFGDFYAGKKITYVQQEELNGSGGAIHLVKDLIRDDFMVMNGDDLYIKKDLENIMRYDLALLGVEVEEPKKFGIIHLGKNGNMERIIEKPDIQGPAFANAGLYKLNRRFFEYPLVSIGNGEFGLPQTMESMAKDFSIHVEKATDWFAVGDPQQLEKAREIIDRFI